MWKALALALLAATCVAQSQEVARFYRMDFVMKEVEGNRVISSHTYSMMASSAKGPSSVLRAGSKVPMQTNEGGTQYNFYDVGVNIDCRDLKEDNNELSAFVAAEISTTVRENTNGITPPVVRQNKWSSVVLVPLKKATMIFASDDPSSKRQMQLELTATPVK